MRLVAPGLFTKLVAVIFFTATHAYIHAADPQFQLPPSKRNAPKGQRLEFSSSGGAPEIPKPMSRAEELQRRPGLAPNTSGSFDGAAGGGALAPAGPAAAAPMNKELAERMLQQLDRRKNWMVPGAQDDEFDSMISDWGTKGIEKKDAFGDEKNESVMERFLRGDNRRGEEKRKSRDSSPEENETADNKQGGAINDRQREANISSEEANGAVDFSLKAALTPGERNDLQTRRQIVPPTALRGDLGQEMNRSLKEKSLARERDAAQSAEFNALIKPRTGGMGLTALDPINSAPDLTRREFNPVLPRASEPARPEAGSFSSSFGAGAFGAGSFGGTFGGAAPGASFGAPDRGMFGVAVPTAPNFTPSAAQPAPRRETTFNPASSIILEPPKRIF